MIATDKIVARLVGTMELQVHAGDQLAIVITNAIMLADRHKNAVRFIFNDVEILVFADSNVEKLMLDYHANIGKR